MECYAKRSVILLHEKHRTALFKSRFCALGGGIERPCVRTRRKAGPSLGAGPPERVQNRSYVLQSTLRFALHYVAFNITIQHLCNFLVQCEGQSRRANWTRTVDSGHLLGGDREGRPYGVFLICFMKRNMIRFFPATWCGMLLICAFPLRAQWTEVPAATLSNSLERIQFVNPTVGYCLDSKGYLLKTTNGGDTWQAAYLPTGSNYYVLEDFYFTDANFGVAVGLDFWAGDYLVLATTNGGSTWAPHQWEYNLELGSCHAVDFGSADVAYAVADFGRFFKTTNAGLTWSASRTPLNAALTDVDFVTPQLGFASTSEVPERAIGCLREQQVCQTERATDHHTLALLP